MRTTPTDTSRHNRTDLRRISNLFTATLVILGTLLTTPVYAQQEQLEGKPIVAINITSKRTSPEEISARIVELKKGGPYSLAAENKVKKRLHEMGVFRKLEVKSRYDEAAHGVVVDINADDGWFIVPLPLVTSGSSGSGYSLMLVSGNMFHRAETLFLRGTIGPDNRSAIAAIDKGNWRMVTQISNADYAEKQYADGAYNTLGTTPDTTKVGQPVNSYTRSTEQSKIAISRKLNDSHTIGASFSMAKFDLKDGMPPLKDEPGRHNMIGLKYAYTHEGNGGISQQGGGMGVVFGLGLSDLDDRVNKRKNIGNLQVLEFNAISAGSLSGSQYDYSIMQAAWRGVWEFNRHDKLAFRVSGSKGWALPFTQFIPTGPDVGLRGQYRREWRGTEGIGGTVSFSHFLNRSKRGILAVEPFAESAWVWHDGNRYNQSGAGINLYYQFWRFPMPLGLSYTWSFADKDGMISMAAGFAFGK